jgi:hypothetical protein
VRCRRQVECSRGGQARALWAGLLGGLIVGSAACLEASAEPKPEVSEEVVVYADLFARWDNTRWSVRTELFLPFRLPLNMELNKGFQTYAVQMETVFVCNKTWKLGRRHMEVDCVIEDFAMRSLVREKKPKPQRIEDMRQVLQELDERLTGARIQLQVADDGRVTNFDLEGLKKDNRRLAEMHEVQRQLMRQVLAGFHLRLRREAVLKEGQWHEYNSELMTIPVPPELTASAGSSLLVHYLNAYEGYAMVQSIGEAGLFIDYGGGREVTYSANFDGVALFDPEDGFMVERVWTLRGTPTASAQFGLGYWHVGRIRLLEEREPVVIGSTGPRAAAGVTIVGLEAWETMSEP